MMNYIDLIKKFWIQHDAYSLTVTDTALYFYLLEINNLCRWEDSFNRKNNKIMADLNISFPTLSKSRNKLKQVKLVDFETQNGSSTVRYTLKDSFKVYDRSSFKVCDEVGAALYNVRVEDKNKNNSLSLINTYDEIARDALDKSLNKCYAELKNDRRWIETLCINTRLLGFENFSSNDFFEKLEEFFMKLQNEGEVFKSVKDAKSHFSRWLKIELEKLKNNEKRLNGQGARRDIISRTTGAKNRSNWSIDGPTDDFKEFIDSFSIGR